MNHGWTYRNRISPQEAGVSALDHYLKRHTHSSEAEWRTRFAEGRVTRDGCAVAADALLNTGDVLACQRPPWEEPEVPRAFTILYEDDDLLAVDKPAGLPVLPGGGYVENTLLHLLRLQISENPPIPVHRLGRGTSGVVLFARSAMARSQLAGDFRDVTHRAAGALRKIYRALTGPAPDLPLTLEIAQPIGPVAHPTLGWVHAASPAGKPSQSRCRILKRAQDETLWEIDLITGRPHQIRIHLAWAGVPLLGDPLYGPGGVPSIPTEGRPPVPGDCGYWLHACSLTLAHPRTGRLLSLSAPPPGPLVC